MPLPPPHNRGPAKVRELSLARRLDLHIATGNAGDAWNLRKWAEGNKRGGYFLAPRGASGRRGLAGERETAEESVRAKR
jgi:hypothetical protein